MSEKTTVMSINADYLNRLIENGDDAAIEALHKMLDKMVEDRKSELEKKNNIEPYATAAKQAYKNYLLALVNKYISDNDFKDELTNTVDAMIDDTFNEMEKVFKTISISVANNKSKTVKDVKNNSDSDDDIIAKFLSSLL